MSKDDFLGRWSKRKLADEQEKPDSAQSETADAVSEQVSEPAPLDDVQIALLEDGGGSLVESGDENQVEGEGEGEGEEHEPHPAEGIDIEKLEYESDFTVFMDEKVPKVLKRMALRKLWLSSPILANVDGLNDYDEDFSDAAAIFINSAGKVISGARDQIWDDDQIAEGKDRIGAEKNEEEEVDESEASTEEIEQEVAEADGSGIDDIEDGDVEDIDDVVEPEFVRSGDNAELKKTNKKDTEKSEYDDKNT